VIATAGVSHQQVQGDVPAESIAMAECIDGRPDPQRVGGLTCSVKDCGVTREDFVTGTVLENGQISNLGQLAHRFLA
jgi:hypothetical protein